MTRTVKVKLEGDGTSFDKTMAVADTATTKLTRDVEQLDRKLQGSLKSGPKLPVQLDPLTTTFRAKVDAQVKELSRQVALQVPVTPDTAGLRTKLAMTIASLEHFNKIKIPVEVGERRKYEHELTDLLGSVTHQVESAGVKLGEVAGSAASDGVAKGMSVGMSNPAVGAALTTSLVVAAAAAAQPAAAIISGALLVGLGGGVMAAGIALASQDPRVNAAASKFGLQFMSEATAAADVFVAPLERTFQRFSETSSKIMPEVAADFAMLAPYVDKLTIGLDRFVMNMLPGISDAISNLRPYLDAVARELPDLGDAVGDFFRVISADSERGAHDLETFFKIVGGLIRATAVGLTYLSDSFNDSVVRGLKLASFFTDVMSKIPGPEGDMWAGYHQKVDAALDSYTSKMPEAAGATDQMAASIPPARTGIELLSGTMQDAANSGNDFLGVWSAINGDLLAADQSALAANQALEAVSTAFQENGLAIEGNTDAALKNRIAVGEAVQAAADNAAKVGKETGSIDLASQAYNGYIDQLRNVLGQADLTGAQIDTLISKYAAVPPSVYTSVNAQDNASQTISELQWKLDHLPGYKTIYIQTVTNSINRVDELSRRLGVERWGGAYTHAASGLLNEARTYSATSPGRYMIAEPQTGGEAFVPRRGNYGRSMSILNQAAGWYGAQVTPAGGGAPSTIRVVLEYPDGRVIRDQLITYASNTGQSPSSLLPSTT